MNPGFLFPMVKTFLLLFISLCLLSLLVASCLAKLLMASLPPRHLARTFHFITLTFALTWPVRNSRESTKANTTKIIYLRKYFLLSILSPTQPLKVGLGNLCSNKQQSMDCAATRKSCKLFRSQHVFLEPVIIWPPSIDIVLPYRVNKNQ